MFVAARWPTDNMEKCILLKYGELILKGLNKGRFEKLLLSHIRSAIAPYGEFSVYTMQSAVYVEAKSGCECDFEGAYEAAKKVFGIAALSLCALCEKDMEAIKETAAQFLADRLQEVKTFKVEAKRADKRFPLGSPQISAEVGGYLLEKFPHLKVDVHNPDLIVMAEVRDQKACVHEASEKGAGGLPVGANGKAMLLISGGIDSPVAGYMMAKRGVSLSGVHFFSYPYTSERAKDKVKTLLRTVARYSGNIHLTVVPFTEIQEAIRDHCEEDYFTLVMRAFMMIISEKVAKNKKCGALITGESLGQVASQTMEAIGVTESFTDMAVLRPVIGMDKVEIIEIAHKIDTFETSILPYEDCCTVFTPRHPRTKPKEFAVRAQMNKLDVEGLIERAMAGIEEEIITPSAY